MDPMGTNTKFSLDSSVIWHEKQLLNDWSYKSHKGIGQNMNLIGKQNLRAMSVARDVSAGCSLRCLRIFWVFISLHLEVRRKQLLKYQLHTLCCFLTTRMSIFNSLVYNINLASCALIRNKLSSISFSFSIDVLHTFSNSSPFLACQPGTTHLQNVRFDSTLWHNHPFGQLSQFRVMQECHLCTCKRRFTVN